VAPLLIAVAISAAWCLLALVVGPRLGFVDDPGRSELTAHDRPAVPLGGVGVYLAVNVVTALDGGGDIALLMASTIVLILGLVDDRVGLPPVLRLAVEVAAAVGLVFAGDIGAGDPLSAVVAVAAVVVAINAVNLYDGLDGLAGLTSLVSAAALAVLLSGSGASATTALALVGALGGFMLFNWHPARVFLGDSGAYVIGLVLAHLALESGTGDIAVLLVWYGALGVILIDLFASVIRRLRSRGALFEGDRNHVYDQLRRRGMTIPGVALASAGLQLVLVAIVVIADRELGSWPAFFVVAGVAFSVLALLARAGLLTPAKI